MPLYIGDYLADTAHLTCEQHGAYLLLIMHYWKTGGLPPDESSLKRICGLQGQGGENKWRSICLAIAPFFEQPGWRHKRIEAELQKAEIISTKRKMAGMKGGQVSRGFSNVGRHSTQAIAKQTGGQSHKKDKKEGLQEESKGFATPSLTALVREKGWAQ